MQVAVKEFPAFALKFLHPGSTLPLTLKVTFPATDAVAVTLLAVRKVSVAPASEIAAENVGVALLKVKVKVELVALV